MAAFFFYVMKNKIFLNLEIKENVIEEGKSAIYCLIPCTFFNLNFNHLFKLHEKLIDFSLMLTDFYCVKIFVGKGYIFFNKIIISFINSK